MTHPLHILAIDPGAATGWALHNGDAVVASGTWLLQATRYDSPGMKFVRLRGYLNDVQHAYPRLHIAYEKVVRHAGTHASHMYGGYVATLLTWCHDKGFEFEAVNVADVKRKATGKGNAKKDEMLDAARAKWPEAAIEDHNEADARFIAECAAEHYEAAATV